MVMAPSIPEGGICEHPRAARRVGADVLRGEGVVPHRHVRSMLLYRAHRKQGQVVPGIEIIAHRSPAQLVGPRRIHITFLLPSSCPNYQSDPKPSWMSLKGAEKRLSSCLPPLGGS